MTISSIIEERGISEIMHFTTNEGLLGILHTRALKSRQRLPQDKQVEFIYRSNASFRKDTPWLDYVNLSISRINAQFFDICANRWHTGRDIWWCILSFDLQILTHDDVYFATTNNMYTGVKRSKGASGLESLFARRVVQYSGNFITRNESQPSHLTTCPQAEVLYPGEVSTDFLLRVYVQKPEHVDDIRGQCSGVGCPNVDVVVNADVFRGESA